MKNDDDVDDNDDAQLVKIKKNNYQLSNIEMRYILPQTDFR